MRHPRGIDLLAPIRPARYEEHVKSTSVYETTNGMREWEVLGAKCGKCGHIGWLDHRQVTRRFGSLYLNTLDYRLVCQCGNRQGNKVLVGRLGRD